MSLFAKLLHRAVIAIALLAVLFGSAYLGGWPWFALVTVLTLIALSEYYSAVRTKDIRPEKLLGWLTDLLDGGMARMMGQGGTLFGKVLDSTIDFALMLRKMGREAAPVEVPPDA